MVDAARRAIPLAGAPRSRPRAVVREGKMAAAAVKSIGGGLGRGLRELRIHLCQRSASSRGVRSAQGWAGPGQGFFSRGNETPPG